MSDPAGEAALGLLTIGRAPRDDLAGPVLAALPADLPLHQAGVLDPHRPEEVPARLGAEPGRSPLITCDGDATVLLDPDKVHTALQETVARLVAAGSTVVALLCTGRFPGLTSPVPLLEPDVELVRAAEGIHRLGIVVPLPDQTDEAAHKWAAGGHHVQHAVASPYGPDSALELAGRSLRGRGLEWIVLDCMGFTADQAAVVQAASGVPTFAAGTLVGRAVAAQMVREAE